MLKLADQYRDQHNEEPPDNFFDIMEKTTRDVQKEMYDFNINQHRKKLRQLQKEFMGGKNAKSV